ncbi:MAG: response regulator transcription factor [Candidatus Rokubacteria bacterium]|nr:response regulator transcription factor [Candidatus Rokubacteria bacterium]
MADIRLLLVDDNPTFLRLATRFLEAQDEIRVVGSLRSGTDALARVHDLRPDVVVIDLAMPGLSGLEAIPLLRRALPDAGIIAVTLLDTAAYRQAALAAGADDFVPKMTLSTELLPAIRRIALAHRTVSGA